MKRTISYLSGILFILVFGLQACSKQEEALNNSPQNPPTTVQKEVDNYEFTIVDTDNWKLDFDYVNPYYFNALFGVGKLSWTRYGVPYTDVASFIHDNASDAYTVLCYEPRRSDYLLYLMCWDNLTATLSRGAYIFLKPNGYFYTVKASITSGSVGEHSVSQEAYLKESQSKNLLLKEGKSSINPDNYECVIRDSDNWMIYLNKYSFVKYGCHFYQGFMSWTRYGVEYIGNATAIYDSNRDVLGVACWDDRRKDAIQYNISFINETSPKLFGHYIFTKNNPYHYKIWADLEKGQIGSHLAVLAESANLKDIIATGNKDK